MTEKVQEELNKILKQYQLNNIKNIDWNLISEYQILSEEFIEKYQDKLCWNWISQCQTLSEEFIEKFKNKVYWSKISIHQVLSEQFIEQFQDKVYWHNISRCQKFSASFVMKFQDKLDLQYLIKKGKLTIMSVKVHGLVGKNIKSDNRFQLLDI